MDDHDLFRMGLRALLSERDLAVVAEASSGEQAVELAARHQPDVVVMDLSMPGMGGVAATRELARAAPCASVLVLTISTGDERVTAAIQAGAAGYLLKDEEPDVIVAGIRAAAAGEALISPRIAAGLLDQMRAGGDARVEHGALSALTERELQVLRLLGGGSSNAEIGAELHVSVATVKNHVANILAKLGVQNRTEAAVYAARAGLV